MRSGNFDVALEANCQSVVNPLPTSADTCRSRSIAENYGKFEDPQTVEIYKRCCTRPTWPSSAR